MEGDRPGTVLNSPSTLSEAVIINQMKYNRIFFFLQKYGENNFE